MKPVAARHITVLVWTFAVLVTLTLAAPAPAENRAQDERADAKIDGLRDKIQKLQVLLEQNAKAKATHNNQNSGDDSGNAPSPVVDKAPVIKEPMTSSHNAPAEAGETIAKLISQLNRKDVQIPRIDGLRDKIQKLQVLLEQNAKAKATHNNQNSGDDSGNAPSPVVDKAPVIKEPMTSSHNAPAEAGETIAKLISQLNRKDVQIPRIDGLRDKIQKLQVLLEQYAKAKATHNNQNSGDDSGNAPSPVVDKAPVIKEPMTSSHNAPAEAGETIAKLISQLNRKDVQILRKLVEILDKLDGERSQGVFHDKPVPESQEGTPQDLKDKVARVLNDPKNFYKSKIEYNPGSRLSRTQNDPVRTEEGTFGEFANENGQLLGVERKLIEDLITAAKQGYTIEDIIRDLEDRKADGQLLVVEQKLIEDLIMAAKQGYTIEHIIRDLEDRKAAKQEHEKRRTQEERELSALLKRSKIKFG